MAVFERGVHGVRGKLVSEGTSVGCDLLLTSFAACPLIQTMLGGSGGNREADDAIEVGSEAWSDPPVGKSSALIRGRPPYSGA